MCLNTLANDSAKFGLRLGLVCVCVRVCVAGELRQLGSFLGVSSMAVLLHTVDF